MNKMHKSFTVLIHDKEYDVWSIEGKEHQGLNNTIDTWWLYYSERLPNGIEPPIDSEYWVPYCVGINRRLWDIRFRQHNTSKIKWNDYSFSNTTVVDMYCNSKLVYRFLTTGSDSGLAFAMNKVGYLKTILSEHCFDFFNPEKENGRKIWWKGLPATIKVREQETWEIKVYPDYTTGLTKEQWWEELSKKEEKLGEYNKEDDWDFDDDEGRDYINWGDVLEDGHIGWFRK